MCDIMFECVILKDIPSLKMYRPIQNFKTKE